MNPNTEEDHEICESILQDGFSWDIIRSYFKGQYLKRLVSHQLESYNDFISNQIERTINMFNPVIIHSEHDYNKPLDKYSLEIEVIFTDFNIYRPQIHENNGATKIMFPQEARLRNFTYSTAIFKIATH